MTRRPLIVILGVLMAFAVASPVAATSAFPSRLDLPAGWMPEGITAGAGNTVYVGSLAGGGVWAADVWTGEGHILVPPWGGAATGVEYEKGAHRLWVAGATTGTVRVYDTRTGALWREYTFPGTVFLNDLVVTKDAVYVTDSLNPWLDVIPLGPNGALPAATDVTTLPLTGIVFEPGQFNANGIVAKSGWLVVVDSFTGGLFRVDPRTGVATAIPTGGVSVTNGDGLELRGATLYVVRNQDQIVEVFKLGHRVRTAKFVGNLPSTGLSIPTTAAFQAGSLWVVNARFGIPTTEYWVSRLPAKP
jgi:hypothetical protein